MTKHVFCGWGVNIHNCYSQLYHIPGKVADSRPHINVRCVHTHVLCACTVSPPSPTGTELGQLLGYDRNA